jgi:hypothetical protein
MLQKTLCWTWSTAFIRIQHLIATSGLTLRKPLESSYPLLQVARSKGSLPAAAVQKATLHAKALRRKRPELN